MKKKFWEVAGSQMGAAMGVKDTTKEEVKEEEDTSNYKDSGKFAQHMEKASDKVR